MSEEPPRSWIRPEVSLKFIHYIEWWFDSFTVWPNIGDSDRQSLYTAAKRLTPLLETLC